MWYLISLNMSTRPLITTSRGSWWPNAVTVTATDALFVLLCKIACGLFWVQLIQVLSFFPWRRRMVFDTCWEYTWKFSSWLFFNSEFCHKIETTILDSNLPLIMAWLHKPWFQILNEIFSRSSHLISIFLWDFVPNLCTLPRDLTNLCTAEYCVLHSLHAKLLSNHAVWPRLCKASLAMHYLSF